MTAKNRNGTQKSIHLYFFNIYLKINIYSTFNDRRNICVSKMKIQKNLFRIKMVISMDQHVAYYVQNSNWYRKSLLEVQKLAYFASQKRGKFQCEII